MIKGVDRHIPPSIYTHTYSILAQLENRIFQQDNGPIPAPVACKLDFSMNLYKK